MVAAEEMKRPVTLGIGQMEGGPPDAQQARANTLTIAERLFERGADIVMLPELAVPGYVLDGEAMQVAAEPLHGPTVSAWRTLAAAHEGIVCGGFVEREGDAIYNTAVVVGADGVLLHYRKLHLFAEEKLIFAPGDRGLPVATTPFGKIGVCVCYDLRFVETARLLALEGAEIICVPTAWTGGFDPDAERQEVIGQAQGAFLQANLNQVFIACCSVGGRYGDTTFLGSSLVASPWGDSLLGPLSKTESAEEILRVDVADAKASQVRGPLISPRADRRSDVYGLVLDGQEL